LSEFGELIQVAPVFYARSQSEGPILNLAMPASSSVHLKTWFIDTPIGWSFSKFHVFELKFWLHVPISVKINHKSCMETNLLYVIGLCNSVSALFDVRNEV
jgi:hypothetical protein